MARMEGGGWHCQQYTNILRRSLWCQRAAGPTSPQPPPLWMTTPIKLFTKQLTSHKIGDIKINFITLIMAITGCGVLWVIPQRIPDPCWSQWTRNWFSTSYKGHIITFRGSTGRTLECPCLGGWWHWIYKDVLPLWTVHSSKCIYQSN